MCKCPWALAYGQYTMGNAHNQGPCAKASVHCSWATFRLAHGSSPWASAHGCVHGEGQCPWAMPLNSHPMGPCVHGPVNGLLGSGRHRHHSHRSVTGFHIRALRLCRQPAMEAPECHMESHMTFAVSLDIVWVLHKHAAVSIEDAPWKVMPWVGKGIQAPLYVLHARTGERRVHRDCYDSHCTPCCVR